MLYDFGGVVAVDAASEGAPSSGVHLPGFEVLMEQAALDELTMSDGQKAKLSEIAKRHSEGIAELHNSHRDSPPEEIMKRHRQWEREQHKRIRQELQAIFEPQQMQRLETMALQHGAGMWLPAPGVRRAVGATPEQEEQLSRIQNDMSLQMRRETERAAEQAIALLDPPQRAKLTEVVLGPEGPTGAIYAVCHVEDREQRKQLFLPVPAFYPDMTLEPVQDELGLSREQRQRIRDVLGGKRNLMEKLEEEAQHLAPEEQAKLQNGNALHLSTSTLMAAWPHAGADDDSPEARKQWAELLDQIRKQRAQERADLEKNSLWKTSDGLRKQFEAVLTPDQFAAYRDMAVRSQCPYVLEDPLVAEQVAPTDQQRAALHGLFRQMQAMNLRWPRKLGEKMLEILTPPQRQKLREIADRGDLESLAAEGEETHRPGEPAAPNPAP